MMKIPKMLKRSYCNKVKKTMVRKSKLVTTSKLLLLLVVVVLVLSGKNLNFFYPNTLFSTYQPHSTVFPVPIQPVYI